MKRILVLLIAAILLFSSVTVYAAEDFERLTVNCASNLSEDMMQIKLLKKGDQIYISGNDLSVVSGFELLHIDGSNAVFSRSGEKITVSEGELYENDLWFPIERSCEKLYTKVTRYEKALFFKGRECTYNELISLTDKILTNSSYEVIDSHNWQGSLALVGSWIYRFASGDYGKALTGSYKQDIFDDIFKEVMNQQTDVSDVISTVEKGNKYVKTLLSVEELDEDRTIENIITVFGKGITEYEVDDMTKIVDVFLDPIGAATTVELGECEFKLGGLDVASIVDFYYYIDAMISCSDSAYNMINYSYYSNETGKIFDGVNDRMKAAAEKLHNYHNTDDVLNAYLFSFTELSKNILKNTVYDSIDSVLEMAYGAMGGTAAVLKLSQSVLKIAYNYWFQADGKIDFAEISRMTDDLQDELQNIYKKARNNPKLAINAKYIALLYARYCDIYWDAAEKTKSISRPASVGKKYSPVIKLYSVSDSEILDAVSNEKIKFESKSNNGTETNDTLRVIEAFKDSKTVEYYGSDYTYSYSIPAVDSSAPNALIFNQKLYDKLHDYYERTLNYTDGYIYQLRYEANVYRDIAAIRVIYTSFVPASDVIGSDTETYYYDGANDRIINSDAEYISAFGYTLDQLKNAASKTQEYKDLVQGGWWEGGSDYVWDSVELTGCIFDSETSYMMFDCVFSFTYNGTKYSNHRTITEKISTQNLLQYV